MTGCARGRFAASFCVVSLVLCAPGVSAGAAPKAITGNLSKAGYTVIAVPSDGDSRSARARRGRFKLRPRADVVTLQLRAPSGKYAGPIVVGGGGRRVMIGVRAGARLGKIRLRAGFARVARKVPARWLARKRVARARRGVPIGAGNYGRVSSHGAQASRAGGDRDLDGVPNGLDIDDDGDLLLDNFESPRRGRVAQIEETGGYLQAKLFLPLQETTNANATALDIDDIDTALKNRLRLSLNLAQERPVKPGDTFELDCGRPQRRTDPALGGLVYCTRGGTGTKAFYEPTGPFPGPAGGELDPDGDGLGTLQAPFFLLAGAASTQIGTGDVLIQRATRDGVVTEWEDTLQMVFATVPALVSYQDTAGNSATVSYPVPAGGPGTPGNGFPISAPPREDIVLTVTMWRPQRMPIEGEACLLESPPCEWVDIGRLTHSAGFDLGGDSGLNHCPPRAFTVPEDSELSPTTFGQDLQGGLTDSEDDRRARPENVFTYTLNISDCLRDPRGFNVTKSIPWESGEEREFFFMGTNLEDDAVQNVTLKLE